MSKKENKFPVALYIRCNTENENWFEVTKEKEKLLTEYCDKNNYEIVKVFRDVEPINEYISFMLRNIIAERWDSKYAKLIAFDMEEFAEYEEQLVAIKVMLSDNDVDLITLKQGVFGKDIFVGTSIEINYSDKEGLEERNRINLSTETPF